MTRNTAKMVTRRTEASTTGANVDDGRTESQLALAKSVTKGWMKSDNEKSEELVAASWVIMKLAYLARPDRVGDKVPTGLQAIETAMQALEAEKKVLQAAKDELSKGGSVKRKESNRAAELKLLLKLLGEGKEEALKESGAATGAIKKYAESAAMEMSKGGAYELSDVNYQ